MESPQPDLAAALDRLWTKFLAEIRERVSTIESAVRSVSEDELDAECQQAAGAAAHKLAGVLGTFQLERGTELARELELIFLGSEAPRSDSAPRLAAMVAELHSVVNSRS
jgi:chemotaxis protein histidine kinase CheA